MNEQLGILAQIAIDIKESERKINAQIKELETIGIKVGVEIDEKTARKAIMAQDKAIKAKERDAIATKRLSTQMNNLVRRIENYSKLNKRLEGTTQGNDLQKLMSDISNNKINLTDATNKFSEIQKSARAAGLEGKNMWESISGKFFDRAKFLANAAAIEMLRRAFMQMITNVKELNKAFVDIQMVTGGTNNQVAQLMQQYNKMAQSMGATTVEISKSANEFLRQGLNMEDTNNMIEASMVLSKVGMLDSAEAAKYLTAAYKGFKVPAEEVLSIVDKVSAVDLVSATSAGGLMEGMSRVANFANQVGFSMDRLLGTIATIGEVTQREAGSVGDSIRTMLARMSNIKLGKLVDDETGESLSDVETSLRFVGIKLRENETDFRNYSDVLDEVAGRWDSFNDVQKNSIATAFAGQRRIEDFIVMMSNYDNIFKYSTESMNSAGTAMEKFGSYEEGIEAKTKKMKAAFEGLSSSAINSDLFGTLISGATRFLKILNGIIEKFGALPTTIGLVTIAMTAMGKSVGISQLLNFSVKGLPSLKQGFLNLIVPAKQLLSWLKLIPTQMSLLLVANTGYATTSTSAAVAQLGLGKSISIVTKALWAQLIPMAKFAVIAVAVWGAVKVFDALIVTSKEAKESLNTAISELEEVKNSISSINDELKTAQNRVAELQSKGTLTFVEKEELNNLIEGNSLLRQRLALLEAEEDLRQKAVSNAAKKAGETLMWGDQNTNALTTADGWKRVVQQALPGGRGGGNDLADFYASEIKHFESKRNESKTDEEFQRYEAKIVQYKNKLLDKYKEYQDVANKITSEDPASQEVRKQLREQMDFMETFIFDVEQLKAVKLDKLFVSDGGKGIKKELDGLSSSGKLTEESIIKLSETFPALKQYMDENGVSAQELADNFNKVSVESMGTIPSLTEFAKEITSIDELNAKVKDGYAFSFEEITKLREEYPELEKAIKRTANGWVIEQGAVESLRKAKIQLKIDSINSQIDSTKTTVTNTAARIGVIQSEITAIGSLADAYRLIANIGKQRGDILIGSPMSPFGRSKTYKEYVSNMGGFINASSAMSESEFNDLKQATQQITQLGKLYEDAEKAKKQIDELASGSTLGGGSGSSSSSPYRSELDAQLLVKDRYYEINNQIIASENEILRIKSEQDNLNENEVENAERLIELYNDEMSALTEKQKKLHILNQERRVERDELVSSLSTYGVSTVGEGDSMSLANYTAIEERMRNRVNSLRDSKDKVAYTNAKDEYEKMTTLSKRFFDIQLAELPKTSEEWFKLAKEINKAGENIVKTTEAVYDDRLSNSKRYIEDRDFYNNWGADNEIDAWNRVKEYTEQYYKDGLISHEKYVESISEIDRNLYTAYRDNLSDLLSAMEKHSANATHSLKKQAESYDYLISRAQALVDAQQKQYDTQAKIRSVQKDINAQMAASKASMAYLDEDTRKLLFNEDDYKTLSSALTKMNKETEQLHRNYARDISNLNKDNWYLEDAITKEYERRLAMKEQEYELAKKQLDLNKKQQELDNILAEKNVRMLIGGQWMQVANMEEVRRATEELVTLEEEMAEIKLQSEQQQILNRKQAEVDMLSQEQAAYEQRITMINDRTEQMSRAFDAYLNPVKNIGSLTAELAEQGIPRLQSVVDGLINTLNKVGGGTTSDSGSSGRSVSLSSSLKNQLRSWGILPPEYAGGTTNAKGGISLVGEKGAEFRILNQGDGIIPADMTKNLMEWGKYKPAEFDFMKSMGLSKMQGAMKNNQMISSPSYNFNFGGDIVTGNDPEKFLKDVIKLGMNRVSFS